MPGQTNVILSTDFSHYLGYFPVYRVEDVPVPDNLFLGKSIKMIPLQLYITAERQGFKVTRTV